MKGRKGILVLIALVAGACGSGESPDAPAAAQESRVPDVLHMELRDGAAELESEGYVVELSDDLGSPRYVESLNDYLRRDDIGMDPAPHIGATDPAPGSAEGEGSTVTVTEIECPDQAEACD